jgi:hypothetical protein
MSGGEMNKFKEIVDSYSDMEELYAEKLEAWYKSALLNDPMSFQAHYQLATGGGY